jgi:ATP-dependent Clp protease protease subunit
MAKKLDLSMLMKLGMNKENTPSFCMVWGEINEDTSQHIIQYIIESNLAENPPDVLNMLINSPGGSLVDAFAIIDVMASSAIPIQTVGLGSISSAGLLIFLNGTKGRRILTPNTSILSHRYSAGSLGKSHELFAIQKEFDLTNSRMHEVYKKCTGMKMKDVEKYLLPPEDVYLSAEEALQYGVCDKIALLS